MKYAVTAVFLIMGGGAAAAPVTYQCSFAPSDDGWIAGPVTATFDTATEQAAVVDPIIEESTGGRAIAANYKRRNNGKLEATWSLDNVRRGRGGGQKVSWTLQVDPSDNSAVVRVYWAKVGDQDRRPPRGNGTCNTVSSPNLLG